MTDNLFKQAAQALCGPLGWAAALANALDVDPRTVARWAAGTRNVPDGVWSEIQKLLVDHAATCTALAITVESRPRPDVDE